MECIAGSRPATRGSPPTGMLRRSPPPQNGQITRCCLRWNSELNLSQSLQPANMIDVLESNDSPSPSLPFIHATREPDSGSPYSTCRTLSISTCCGLIAWLQQRTCGITSEGVWYRNTAEYGCNVSLFCRFKVQTRQTKQRVQRLHAERTPSTTIGKTPREEPFGPEDLSIAFFLRNCLLKSSGTRVATKI